MSITTKQVNEMLAKCNMDYNVLMYQETNPFDGTKLPFYGTYRDDNNYIFQTGLTKQYHTIQNRDAFKALVDLSEVGDVKLIRGGTWGKGREAFAQVDLNGGFAVGGNPQDIIQQRCTFYKRHDGNGGLTYFLTPHRTCCANQCASMLRQVEQAQKLKISHTVSGMDRLKILAKQYQIIDGAFQETRTAFDTLADTKVTQETIAEVINRLFPVVPGASKRAVTTATDAQASIGQFISDADGGLIAWDTAWNLYNAITRYTTHVRGGFANKEKSLLIGTGMELMEDALETIQKVTAEA